MVGVPLTPVLLSTFIIGVMCRRKLILKMSHLLGKAETGLGESNIPYSALIMGKRTKVKLGHYIERFSERTLKITPTRRCLGKSVGWMGVEVFFVSPTEGGQTRWWGGLEGGFLDGAMLRITKQQRVGRKTY
jgi:hypothetical protein